MSAPEDARRRLLFDARYIRPGSPDGIGRYSRELAHAVAEQTPPGWQVAFIISDPRQRDALPPGSAVVPLWAPTSWREPWAALRLNREHPDVVFSPMQTIGTAGRRFRAIVTLHDLIYYRHRTPPKDMPGPIRLGWRLFHLSYLPQRIILNAADAVCTVSETSRRQILAARLTRRPLLVVSNAAVGFPGTCVRPSASDVVNLVYMGSFMGYKNVETLVRAAGVLGAGYRLHLLSRISEEREQQLRRIDARARLAFHHGVSDEEYARVLQDRAILVTASEDEGYGLPVAEALATGVPAVVSDLDIFHEVAGEGAVYFAPTDAQQLADRVRSLRDPAQWERVVAAGRAHLRRFSWQQSAQTLWHAVRELARD